MAGNSNMFKITTQNLTFYKNSFLQYYILVTNFIFMGIVPILIMVVFNVLVVRAIKEANERRARMTRRQQRNITVTSMLVSHTMEISLFSYHALSFSVNSILTFAIF